MSILEIDGALIRSDDIDFLAQSDINERPAMVIHLRSGDTSSCVFPSEEDRESAWEMIRTLLQEEDFYECLTVFFKKEAIVAMNAGDNDDGYYMQLMFRGDKTLRLPLCDKAESDLYISEFEKLLADRPHHMH